MLVPTAPSGPPVNFHSVALNSRSISLSWNPPLMEHQNGIIRQYIVKLVSLNTNESFTAVVTASHHTVYGLRPYTTYTCSVAAETIAVGPSAESLIVNTTEDSKL